MDNAVQWSEKVLQLTMSPPPTIQYFSPMGTGDHVTLELEIQEDDEISYIEDYKKEIKLCKSKF
ncbi:hypothetical protein E2C01_038049 [Portunus trituberculatus]|uniref:Uncharacterized protein n=1 Tax=Portunus trituberculatus TaxID=210409 RepID=A0A5B7FG88_PORTR|nr:hypothetical protein [Portunus trituberculatus]